MHDKEPDRHHRRRHRRLPRRSHRRVGRLRGLLLDLGRDLTDPAALSLAEALVRDLCDQVDRACSRFRPDAEIHALPRAAGRMVAVSPLLAD